MIKVNKKIFNKEMPDLFAAKIMADTSFLIQIFQTRLLLNEN